MALALFQNFAVDCTRIYAVRVIGWKHGGHAPAQVALWSDLPIDDPTAPVVTLDGDDAQKAFTLAAKDAERLSPISRDWTIDLSRVAMIDLHPAGLTASLTLAFEPDGVVAVTLSPDDARAVLDAIQAKQRTEG